MLNKLRRALHFRKPPFGYQHHKKCGWLFYVLKIAIKSFHKMLERSVVVRSMKFLAIKELNQHSVSGMNNLKATGVEFVPWLKWKPSRLVIFENNNFLK
jgi:hypothetical protein